jgi:ABC-2 type transport system permease protein
VRSRIALIGILVLVALSSAAGATSFAHIHAQSADRAALQAKANALFEDQPDRHPHRMVHYGQYAYRPVSALSAFDPGVDPYTGTVLYLEGHRQNSATFSAVRENSSLMRFGALTPAFVLQTLAPLLLIFLGFSVVARERESATLAQLRAHGVSAAQVIIGKTLALACIAFAALLPALLVLALISLQSSQNTTGAALIALGYGVYLAIWVIAIVAISAWMRTAGAALMVLAAVWSATTILAPRLAADVAGMLHPLPSRAETDLAIQAELRTLGDSHNPDDPFFAAFRQRTLAQYGVARIEDLPFNFRGAISAEGEALTSRLFNEYSARMNARLTAQSQVKNAFSVISPAIAARRISMSAAGSDLRNHMRFLEQAEAYRFDLIQRLNGLHRDALTLADDAARSRDPEAERRTRISQANWAQLPDFRFTPPSPSEKVAAAATGLSWLAIWLIGAVALAIFAARRLARSVA